MATEGITRSTSSRSTRSSASTGSAPEGPPVLSGTRTGELVTALPQRTQGVREGQARAPRLKRVADAIKGAPFEIAGPVPGIGRTLDTPLRSGLPPKRDTEVEVPVREPSSEPLSEQPTGLWQRPDRSTANKVSTAVVPWLKPRALKEVATLQKEIGTQALAQGGADEVAAGFAMTPATSAATRAFGTALSTALDAMPVNPSPDALPAAQAHQIASQAMAQVTGGDAVRAQALLAQLQAHPVEHWFDRSVPSPQPPLSQADGDVLALLRLMSVVPRGAELMQLLGANGDGVPTSPQLQALRSFWSASQALTTETSEPVRQWLGAAQQVARKTLAGASLEGVADVDRAAYNAVRNGYVSNAPGSPYDRHDQRMRKMTEAWIRRANDGSAKARLGRLWPNTGKTPYRRRVLVQLNSMAENFGMDTPRAVADRGLKSLIGQLAALALDEEATPQQRHFDAALQVLIAKLSSMEHPSQATLGPKDFDALRTAVRAQLDAPARGDGPHRLQKQRPLRDQPLPPPFHAMAAGPGIAVIDVLQALATHLHSDELQPDANLTEVAGTARMKRFDDKADILRYFKPLLANWGLRDKLRLAEGGAAGGGVPFLPYSWLSPIVSPIFSAGVQRKDEAFMQVFMPILGPEISIGSGSTVAGEVTAGVGIGPEVADHVVVQASISGKYAKQSGKTESTIVRFPPARGQDAMLRAQMYSALESMVMWDELEPASGRAFAGPMEALLARNETVSIAKANTEAGTTTLEGRVGADVKAKGIGLDGNAYAVGVSVGVVGRAERNTEWRNDEGGHIGVKHDKGDTRQQKLFASAQLGALTPTHQEPHTGGGVPWQLRADRRLFWNLEKHAISPFLIGGKQDADLDRHYDSPRDMQAEIDENRHHWIARCIETLPANDDGVKDTPENRARAEQLLAGFERDIATLGDDSNFCQFNVNYSMRPQASARIDSQRALQVLADIRGDGAAAARHAGEADAVLKEDGTWRPLMLIVREKGKDAVTAGVNYGLRLQQLSSVEGQRTAAQFPPA